MGIYQFSFCPTHTHTIRLRIHLVARFAAVVTATGIVGLGGDLSPDP